MRTDCVELALPLLVKSEPAAVFHTLQSLYSAGQIDVSLHEVNKKHRRIGGVGTHKHLSSPLQAVEAR